MPNFHDAMALLTHHFGPGPPPSAVSVPGRVNLIGEHIDYHDLPVLPIAIQRRITVAFRPRADRRIRAISGAAGEREFVWTRELEPGPSGDWVNYVKAAALSAGGRWCLERGIDAAIESDLPAAAGLSSSSALLTAVTLALLQVNGVAAGFEDLMDILPEGERFVGTRGGGMDHAAVLASRPGCALLVNFAPVSVRPVPIPCTWSFLVAHSLIRAEKSGALRAEYNARRSAGQIALQRLGFSSYAAAIEHGTFEELNRLAAERLSGLELRSFLHVIGEAVRVSDAVLALRNADASAFGQLLNASHASLRDLLRVSSVELDMLVDVAREAGALGARLTGAGFGGCVVILCSAASRERVRAEIIERYYSGRDGFDAGIHLIDAVPSAGALFG